MAKIVYMQLENDSETDKNEDSGTRVITHNKEIKKLLSVCSITSTLTLDKIIRCQMVLMHRKHMSLL